MANFTGAQRSNYVMFKPEKLEQVIAATNPSTGIQL